MVGFFVQKICGGGGGGGGGELIGAAFGARPLLLCISITNAGQLYV